MALTESYDFQKNKTLQECMLHMLTHEIMCDVTLKVGENQTPIRAHKYMLASRSPVFYTMFEGSLPEEGEISILDIEEDTFRTMLRYFYTDEIKITNENVKDILYCAEKYMLYAVKAECSKVLQDTACSSNSVVALLTARQFHLDELQKASMTYIEDNTKECLESEHAMRLSKDCLEDILRSDCLSCSETDICKFFIKWTEKQCEMLKFEVNSENLRKAAGSLITLVRFPTVSKEYFAKEVSHSPLLTLPEIVSVFRSHYGENNTLFSEKERVPVKKRKSTTVQRYTSTKSTWTGRGVEAIIVRANKNIFLRGIIVFSCVSQVSASKRNFVLEIKDENDTLMHTSNHSVDNVDGFHPNVTSKRLLPRHFEMKENKPYTIAVKDLDVNTYYGDGCQESLTWNGVVFTFETSPFCTTGTDISKGQIGGILFSL